MRAGVKETSVKKIKRKALSRLNGWKKMPVEPVLSRLGSGIWDEAYNKGGLSSSALVVLIRRGLENEWGTFDHMMLSRFDGEVIESQWSTLQQAKNELFGPELEAIEIYPTESRKRDGANAYHLYVRTDGAVPMGAAAGERFHE